MTASRYRVTIRRRTTMEFAVEVEASDEDQAKDLAGHIAVSDWEEDAPRVKWQERTTWYDYSLNATIENGDKYWYESVELISANVIPFRRGPREKP